MSIPNAAPPSTVTNPTLVGYQLRLPTFEGPLDLLLRLVERDHLPITDVSLVSVTDQFLAYLATIETAPAGTIAEFAAVGARLVLLKSRSLLPRPASVDETEQDPSELVRQLTEYQRIRDVAKHLGHWDRLDLGAFERGGGVVVPSATGLPPLAAHQPNALVRAIRRRLTTLAPRAQPVISRPLISLREMIERVLTALAGGSNARFSSVARMTDDRHEVLTAFLAVLVLVRRRLIVAHQSELFGEIEISKAEPDRETSPSPDIPTDEYSADD